MIDAELNKLIAEKVMGWCKIHCLPGGNQLYGAQPDDYDLYPSNPRLSEVPNYANDIEHAWQVVEKLCERWPDVGVSRTENGWGCSWGMDGAGWQWIEAETVTRAICLAAVAAVGVEVD
jgi:hypothetical protein